MGTHFQPPCTAPFLSVAQCSGMSVILSFSRPLMVLLLLRLSIPSTLVSLPVDCGITSVGCALLLGIWAAAPRGNAFRGIEEARRLYSGVSGRSLPSLLLKSFPYFIEILCWRHLRMGWRMLPVVIRVVLGERKSGEFSFGLPTATALAQNTPSMEARESSVCSWKMSMRLNLRLSFLILSIGILCQIRGMQSQARQRTPFLPSP